MRLIWKLLRKHISIFELAVFFVANLIGLVVILSGVQIYSDAKPLMGGGEESLIGSDYIAISKEVEKIGFKNDKGLFTEEEIAELKANESIVNVGSFSALNFKVWTELDIAAGVRPFESLMFFEAVPDEFIDVDLEKWHVDTQEIERRRSDSMDADFGFTASRKQNDVIIPIIIPRNYLNLYNFGFSRSQKGLPQLSENGISRMAMDVTITGDKLDMVDGKLVERSDQYKGVIIGFSDRINTILVPQQFIEWANDYYADDSVVDDDDTADKNRPSRLILEVNNPSDPALISFLEEKGYISEGEPSESGKAMVILQRSVAVVVAIGALFCLLSIIILTLSIYLLLQKNIDKLENLVLIGHTPLMVSMPYIIMTLVLNLSIMLASFGIIAYGRDHFLIPIFEDFLGAGVTTSMTPTYITGVILTVAIVAFNVFIIYHKVSQISRKR